MSRDNDNHGATAAINEDLMRHVVRDVIAVQPGRPDSCVDIEALLADLTTCRLDMLGIDSLLIAEIVVELEQHLGALLELAATTRMETLADLRTALQPTANP